MKEPKNGMIYNTEFINYQPLKSEVMLIYMDNNCDASIWGIFSISSNGKPVFQHDREGEYLFTHQELLDVFQFDKWIEVENKKIKIEIR